MKFIKNFKKFLAFVFAFLLFIPGFNHNVNAVGNINILIVGDRGVGKSTLLHRIVTQNFENPLKPEEVDKIKTSYEHGRIYECLSDARIKVAEMDIRDESDYMDYLYQNANIIIHMSDVKNPPKKQEISNWYDKFVRTIFRGVGDARGLDCSFKTNTEDYAYANKWFEPLQRNFKIGYIIFTFNKLDTLPDFSAHENCKDLWLYISKMLNSRSILELNCLAADVECTTLKGLQKTLVTLDDWTKRLSELSSFESYDETMFEKKKTKSLEKEKVDLQIKYRQFLEEYPRSIWSGIDDKTEFNEFKKFYDFAESYGGDAIYRLHLLQQLHNEFCKKHPEFKEKRDRQTKFYRFVLESSTAKPTTKSKK